LKIWRWRRKQASRFANHRRQGSEHQLEWKGPAPAMVRFQYEWVVWIGAIVLGLLQVCASRQTIAVDAVSYLDMGDAFLRGQWATAVTGYWNPLYGILVSPALFLTAASPALEYPLVHSVVFVFYLGALFAFGFFLKELLSLSGQEPSGAEPVRASHWLLLGYALFMWSSLDLIEVSQTDPDMLVTAFVYLATGLVLRICRRPAAWGPFALLGATLGLAYLTKAFMFPGSLIFLAVVAIVAGRRKGALARVAVAVVVFSAMCLPFIATLSLQRNRLTFGESGRLNYAWHVNGVRARHWQGGPPEAGHPLHPTRQILAIPATYEFSRPIRVTYPLWYDPSYWYEGVRVVFRPLQQARALVLNLGEVCLFSFGLNGTFAVGLLILVLLGPRWSEVGRWVRRHWFVTTPSVLCVGLYGLVYVEGRYIGAFLTIILLCSFIALSAGAPDRTSRAVIKTLGSAALIMVALGSAPRAYSLLHDVVRGEDSMTSPAKALAATRTLGLMPGDKVATSAPANSGAVLWARLARVQIVAEVRAKENGRESFWDLTSEEQNAAFTALARIGAIAIVSDSKPQCRCAVEWKRLGDTDYYVHFLGRKDGGTGAKAAA
jgi:4-amino-4-deoxy-L-arabinose transferase-like glycosyltransferase